MRDAIILAPKIYSLISFGFLCALCPLLRIQNVLLVERECSLRVSFAAGSFSIKKRRARCLIFYSALLFSAALFLCSNFCMSSLRLWIKEKIKKQTPSKENGGGKKINVIQIMPLCSAQNLKESHPAIEPSPSAFLFSQRSKGKTAYTDKQQSIGRWEKLQNYLRPLKTFEPRRKHIRSAWKQLFHQQCTLGKSCVAPAALRNTLSSRAFSK